MTMCTSARPSEGVRSPNLDTNITDPLVYVCGKVPCSAEQPLGHTQVYSIYQQSNSCARQAATTQPSWATSTGARRGHFSDAEVDYLDYLGSLDGREPILPPRSSRAVRVTNLFGRLGAPQLELRGGQMGQ